MVRIASASSVPPHIHPPIAHVPSAMGDTLSDVPGVTANAQSRLYGAANPALTYLSSGLLNGDTLSGSLLTAATPTSNVGTFGVPQGNLANSNYAIAYTGTNPAATAAPLAITANAQSRLYGAANPALTYV